MACRPRKSSSLTLGMRRRQPKRSAPRRCWSSFTISAPGASSSRSASLTYLKTLAIFAFAGTDCGLNHTREPIVENRTLGVRSPGTALPPACVPPAPCGGSVAVRAGRRASTRLRYADSMRKKSDASASRDDSPEKIRRGFSVSVPPNLLLRIPQLYYPSPGFVGHNLSYYRFTWL